MVIRAVKGNVMEDIPVKYVLVSCTDKSGLEDLIPAIVEFCPEVKFMSSTGTYNKIAKILGGDAEKYLMEVSGYTDTPEMEGGLVKTLDPAIHGGILGERGNEDHIKYFEGLGKRVRFLDSDVNRIFDAEVGKEYRITIEPSKLAFIDMVIVNLYEFSKAAAKEGANYEDARGNIDIGGPAMLRAAAKNWLSCAVAVNPGDYGMILDSLRENKGCTTFDTRFELGKKVWGITSNYDNDIDVYHKGQKFEKVKGLYVPTNGGK